MKKCLFIAVALLLSLNSFAQYVRLDISQQVNRRTDKIRILNEYEESRQIVSKAVTIKVESSSKVDLIVCAFYSSGGKVTQDFFLATASAMTPFEKTFYPEPATQTDINWAASTYGWGRWRTGNAKIMTCFAVYNKKTGKFLGEKSTSPKIEKLMKTIFKKEVDDFVRANVG